MYAIGIDSGSQGTKALVVDFDSGKVLGRGYALHWMRDNLKPGESEQDPDTWTGALELALSDALKMSKINPLQVVCLGVSGQQHGFVPVDKEGRPIRPAKLWNDTSTVEETEFLLKKTGGRKGFIKKLGINLAVGYTASKILWLKNKEPENFSKLSAVLLPHDYLNFYLTGRIRMEYGDASGTGLMDIRNRVWHQGALSTIDSHLEDRMPPLGHSVEPVGNLRKEVADKFGLPTVLVSSGGGDNMMGAIGTGNVVPGICTLSLGTSGILYSYFAEPFIDPEGEIAAFCDSTGGWLPLLCTMNVANATEAFKTSLGLTQERLEKQASSVAPGADGLLFLPFLDGERVPELPKASGVFFGLTRKNFNPSHMARSIIEGAILNLAYGFGRMCALGLKPQEIRTTGGGAKSRLWLQVVADVLKSPVLTLEEEEAAAFGAALQAIWCYLIRKGEEVKIEQVVWDRVRVEKISAEPNTRNFEVYAALQERYNSLLSSLREEFDKHERLLKR